MKSFEDTSSYSDSGNTRSSMYSSSSFSQSPPLSSTPTSTSTPIHKPQPPIRPKNRTTFSLNAQEFVPSNSTSYGHYPIGATNEYKFSSASGGNRGTGNGGMNSALPCPMNMAASINLLNTQVQNQLFIQHQQSLQENLQILRQQELAAATVAKQQLLLSATAAAKHPQDEIANSLKMFACLSACKSTEAPSSPVDEVMRDFAANGYTTDDLNKYQQYQAASSMQMLANTNMLPNSHNYNHNLNLLNPGINMNNYLYNQQQFLHDNAYNDFWRQNLIQLMRQTEMANAAAAAAAAINLQYNRKTAKPFKRNFNKKDIPVTAKRCVFCENNKEPDAVVKSHAVRDSQGRVLCPKLRVYVCPICGASGDDAHTVKYCPQKPIITMEDAIQAESLSMPYTGAFDSAAAPKQSK